MSSTAGHSAPSGSPSGSSTAPSGQGSSSKPSTRRNGGGNQSQNGAGGNDKTKRNIIRELNGCVFSAYSERPTPTQYQQAKNGLATYAAAKLNNGGELRQFFETLEMPVYREPIEPDGADPSRAAIRRFEKEFDRFMTLQHDLEANLKALYPITLDLCSPALYAQIVSHEDYATKNATSDLPWLLKTIQALMQNFDSRKHRAQSLDEALTAVINCRQDQHEDLRKFYTRFQELTEIYEHYGGRFGQTPGHYALVDTDFSPGSPVSLSKQRDARELALSMMFLRRVRQRAMFAELQNCHARGQDVFPRTLAGALSYALTWQPTGSGHGRGQPNSTPSGPGNASGPPNMSFAQIAGTDGKTFPGITCHGCGKKGHYATYCPTGPSARPTDASTSGSNFLQVASVHSVPRQHLFTQGASGIPASWILLDSQSTVSIFVSESLVENVRPCDAVLELHTNGGLQLTQHIAEYPGFGTVWFNPHGLANILSLAAVRRVRRVTMDTDIEPAILVHRPDGTVLRFVEFQSGLYFYDTACPPPSEPPKLTSGSLSGYSFLETVDNRKVQFTPREVRGADDAGRLYRKLGRPSQKTFEHALANHLVVNCPVTLEDARRFFYIYGHDPATLKGKMTRKTLAHVPTAPFVPVPAPILEQHGDVTLCADFFFVQKIPFLHTIARKLKFRTVSAVPDRSQPTILKELLATCSLYHGRGFQVTDLHADGEFECVTHDLHPVRTRIAPADAHVGEVERSIRVIKERVRCTVQGLPYRRLPSLMVRALVEDACTNLNAFPLEGGVHPTMSPREIVSGRPPLDFRMLKLEFGAYAQVVEDNVPSNTPATRSTGAIALNPSRSQDGSYHFLSLTTGRRLTRSQWTALPITNDVIERVHAIAEAQGHGIIQGGSLDFAWGPNEPIADDDDEAEDPYDEVVDEFAAGPAAEPELEPHHGEEPPLGLPEVGHIEDVVGDGYNDNEDNEDAGAFPDDDPIVDATADDTSAADLDDAHVVDEGAEDDGTVAVADAEGANEAADEGAGEAADEGAAQPRYSLRPHRDRTYDHFLSHQMDDPVSSESYTGIQLFQHLATLGTPEEQRQNSRHFAHFMFTQMSAKVGLRKHGQRAFDALLKEFAQLQEQDVFEPVDATTLTAAEKRTALRILSVIKEKRCGKIKGRACLDGRPLRALFDKGETASGTVTLESLLLSLMIDAREGRYVSIFDVAGAYLHAELDDTVFVRLTAESIDIMLSINPAYEQFVTIEKGQRVLYVRLRKALYGHVKSALLWYNLFSETLLADGFELNPYDPCVANKMIDGKQCTICWYVDDAKISHADPAVVRDVVKKVEARFGDLSLSEGDHLQFLGMDIDLSQAGKVRVSMSPYIEQAIDAFPERLSRTSPHPAQAGLFDVCPTSPELDPDRRDVFHTIVAKLLYVAPRARPDIIPTIAFLCSRVKAPTESDWKKLRYLLQYLKGTIDDARTLGMDDAGHLTTWVDASYAVHPDMKSHTGGAMSFGTGAFFCKSTKQKLNVKSSTEAELVGASDFLPNTIWTRMFLEHQGYTLRVNEFAQDNQSAMKLAQNGRVSAGPKSRHISIRHFFITDRIGTEGLKVTHWPTESMLADFFTKPLTGSLFQKFRAVLMGDHPISTLRVPASLGPEERVEQNGSGKAASDGNPITTVKADTSVPDRRSYADAVRGSNGPEGSSKAVKPKVRFVDELDKLILSE